MMDAIPQLITAQELAARLQVPVSWIFHRTRAGCKDPIPHVRLGRYVRFNLNDPTLQQWLEVHQVGGASRTSRPLKVVG